MSKYKRNGVNPILLRSLANVLCESQRRVKISNLVSSMVRLNDAVPQDATKCFEVFAKWSNTWNSAYLPKICQRYHTLRGYQREYKKNYNYTIPSTIPWYGQKTTSWYWTLRKHTKWWLQVEVKQAWYLL